MKVAVPPGFVNHQTMSRKLNEAGLKQALLDRSRLREKADSPGDLLQAVGGWPD